MKLVEQKANSKAGVEPDAPLDRKKDAALDGVGRALAWAVLGVFVAECLTGLMLLLYPGFHPGAGSYNDVQYLEFDVPFGMVMRNLHRLFARALLFVAPFAVVRAVLRQRQPGERAARTTAVVALVALALALPVPRSFTPWNTVSAQVAEWLPIDRPAPPPSNAQPFTAGYDARELLRAGQLINRAILRQFYINHALMAPLALISLLAVGAHKLRKRR
jgi:quinol-cytochrome oxidoreductase complex cytochrome b subunit